MNRISMFARSVPMAALLLIVGPARAEAVSDKAEAVVCVKFDDHGKLINAFVIRSKGSDREIRRLLEKFGADIKASPNYNPFPVGWSPVGLNVGDPPALALPDHCAPSN